VCWYTVLLEGVKVKLSPQVYESDCFRHFFLAAMVKLQQFVISEPDEVHHQSKATIQQLSALVATSQLYSQHTMMSALHHD